MTRRRSIVIAGAGGGGTLVAVRILDRGDPGLEVVLLDPSGEPGRGLAYGTRDPRHVLNVPAARMSARAEDPDGFRRWLSARIGREVDGSEYAPRELYGEYLGSVLREAAERGGRLRFVRDGAVDVSPEEGGLGVVLSGGERLFARRAVLALGNVPAPSRFASLVPPQSLVADPWAKGALEAIPHGRVLVLGTGPTMVDVALTLGARPGARLVALSRRGLLPRPHPSARNPWPMPTIASPETARALLRRVRREVRAAAAEGRSWTDVVEGIRPHVDLLWRALPEPERARFLRHVRPYWDVHRHRLAPSVAAELGALQSSGRLQVAAGRLRRLEPTAEGWNAHLVLRGGRRAVLEGLVAAVDATGPESSPLHWSSPLVERLLARGLVRPGPLGSGLDADRDGALIGGDGRPSDRLFTLGPVLRGVRWETTAMPEIRLQAAELAERLGGE